MKRFLPVFSLLLAIVPAAEAQVRLAAPERISLAKPQIAPAPPAPVPAKPDAKKMISILRGQSAPAPAVSKPVSGGGGSSGGGSRFSSPPLSKTSPAPSPGPVVIERRTQLAPQAMPKGYRPETASPPAMEVRRGRLPADGAPEPSPAPGDPSSKTLYMKKGNTPAEGYAPSHPKPSHPAPVKAGRIPAESDPVPPRPRPSGSTGTSRPLASSGGGSGGAHSASPRPAPAPPTELSYRVDASSRLSTDTVKFLKGSVELADQASYDYLFALAEALRSPELGSDRFVVEGHASSDGSDYSNLLLSQRRANAIFDFLASRGVNPGRLLAVGHGESQARFAEHEPEFLRAQDRQVVVYKLAD